MKALINLILGVSLALALAMPATCQVWEEWVARYNGPANGNDEATAMVVDDFGYVYVTGESGGDYATIKYNPSGDTMWVQTYNGPGNGEDRACDLAVDGAGNVYVTGWSYGVGTDYDWATVKYSSNGTQQWVGSYSGPGDDRAYCIAVDEVNSLYITGYCTGIGTGKDYLTIKWSATGTQLWTAWYDGPGHLNDISNSLAVDLVGNVYVTGESCGVVYWYNNDYATVKYNSTGVQQWVQRYTSQDYGNDKAMVVAVNANGEVYVTGYTAQFDYVYTTIKYSPAGDSLWVKNWGSEWGNYDFPTDMVLDTDGNIYVTGYSVGEGEADWATLKYNPAGDTLWVRIWDNDYWYDRANAIAIDGDNNVYVTGYSNDWGVFSLYATVKYNSAGQEQWVIEYGGSGNDAATDVALDASGNVYVTGKSLGEGTGYDYATIKYSQGTPPPPPVSITLTPINPPLQIPASGGSFNFNANLTNNQTTPTTFDVWIMVQLPSMTWYGPVLGPLTLTLPGGASLTRLRTQSVPGSAPAGDYLYEGRVGDYPDDIWDQDGFPFTKQGLDDDGPISDWLNSGESFDENGQSTPNHFDLAVSVSPNPCNPSATINFQLPTAGLVDLSVYDLSGRQVAELVNGWREGGVHEATFDGAGLASGIYLYRLKTVQSEISGKMVLMK